MYDLAKVMNRKGVGTTGVIIGAMISVVIIVAMAIPVTNNVVDSLTCASQPNRSLCTPTASGTLKTVLDLVPLFLGLAGLVTVAALFS